MGAECRLSAVVRPVLGDRRLSSASTASSHQVQEKKTPEYGESEGEAS